ncbi:hypothetical protein QTP88_024342 [Uroleucon formosanum]
MAKCDGSIMSFFSKKPIADQKQIKTQHIDDDDTIDDAEPMVSITCSKPESEDPQNPISKLLDQQVNCTINTSLMDTDFNPTNVDKSNFFYVVDSISKNIKLSSKEKFDLLNTNWCPDPAFKFPLSGKRKLRFQHVWFIRWNWLVYSFKELGAYCKFYATTKFNDHLEKDYHKLSVLKDNRYHIDVQLNDYLKSEIQNNRDKIKPIIDTLILCGCQGLATRGHRDSGRIDVEKEVEGGDLMLKKHLLEAPNNATYLSGKMQNEIISVCGMIIQKQIISKINRAKCFSILADETADVSGIEQFSICARYYGEDLKKLREDFLVFVPVTDVTGKGWVERHDAILVFIELYKAILVALDEISEWEDIDTSSKAK